MSLAVVDQRHAKAFAAALDQAEAGTSSDAGTDPLLHTVALLRDDPALAAPAPTRDFAAALRTRLLDEAAAAASATNAATAAPAPAVPGPRGSHRRRGAGDRAAKPARWRRRVAVLGVCVVGLGGGLGGVAVASQNALPGDLTYPVKRQIEDIKLSLATSDRERGDDLLQQARTRLHEAERLLDRSSGIPGTSTVKHLQQVLNDMSSEAEHGRVLLTDAGAGTGKPGPVRDLADFARTSAEHMDRIDPRLPAAVAPERDQVWTLLTRISDQVSRYDEDTSDDASSGLLGSTTGLGPASQGPLLPGGSLLPSASGAAPQGGADHPQPGATGQAGGTPPPGTPGVLPQVTIPLLGPSADPSATSSQSPGVSVNVPLGTGSPPVVVTIPPILPGLPGIGISLG